MNRGFHWGLALAAGLSLAGLGQPAAAAPVRVCGWLTETLDDDDMHRLELWLEANTDFDFYYMIKGKGIVGDGSRAHSPNKGTFVLSAGEPDKPWSFGTNLTPPGEIDVVVEIHATPADVFSEEEPPLLASFTFNRQVTEDDPAPPKGFGARQCATVTPSP